MASESATFGEDVARSGMPQGTPEEVAALARMMRQGGSPGALEAFDRMNIQIDIRQVLPAIRVPTLVLHNSGDRWVEVERGRDLANRIPGSRFVELPVQGHITPTADLPPLLEVIERFLRDVWEADVGAAEPDRVLATVLFTDIVGSTGRAVELGDARWRTLLEQHHGVIRRELAEHGDVRSTRRATASSRASTGQPGRSAARARSPTP